MVCLLCVFVCMCVFVCACESNVFVCFVACDGVWFTRWGDLLCVFVNVFVCCVWFIVSCGMVCATFVLSVCVCVYVCCASVCD